MLCLVLPVGAALSPVQDCGGSSRTRYEPRTFLGYACEDDCARHKAGFLWAAEHEVADTRSCESLGHPEAQGCHAYVSEPAGAEAAGDRWAIENEIVHHCECAGAGERFFAGCSRQLLQPINTYE